MKNIHVLPTDKPSKLFYNVGGALLFTNYENYNGVNIYITSDEEIKEGDWYIFFNNPVNIEIKKDKNDAHGMCSCKKIILTTDQDLIKDGVQAIDDEFLDWFVKNPSCEEVEVDKGYRGINLFNYKIIIPQEELKQETLTYSEAAKKEERLFNSTMIFKQETLEEVLGSSMCQFSVIENKLATLYRNQVKIYNSINRQQERMYSVEEVKAIVNKVRETGLTVDYLLLTEQFKKK